MNTYRKNIIKLEENDAFVFGSNLEGFHGAGSAGFASFNVPGNRWRDFDYANKPDGWKGKWNVKGIGEGPQVGECGKSYALPTVTKAGLKKSRTPRQISISILKLYSFAKGQPQIRFFVAQNNSNNLNGYTAEEMALMFDAFPIPSNIYFKEEFAELIGKYGKNNR